MPLSCQNRRPGKRKLSGPLLRGNARAQRGRPLLFVAVSTGTFLSTVMRLLLCCVCTQWYGINARAHMQEDRAALGAARKQVELERSVNRKLLQSKADVEYRLMEALAQLPGQTSYAEQRHMSGMSAASPFGSQGRFQDAASIPLVRTSQGAAADLSTDSYVARSVRSESSPISVSASLPAHAFQTTDHPTPGESRRAMSMHASTRASVDTGAVEGLRNSMPGAFATGGRDTDSSPHSSHSNRRTSPLQHCHSPVQRLADPGIEVAAWQDTQLVAGASSPSPEGGGTHVLRQSNGTVSNSEHALGEISNAPVTSASAGGAGEHQGAVGGPCDTPWSHETPGGQQQRVAAAQSGQSPQRSSQCGSPAPLTSKGSVCSESDGDVRHELASSVTLQKRQSAEPSQDQWRQVEDELRGSVQTGFGEDHMQENSLLHANVVRHM